MRAVTRWWGALPVAIAVALLALRACVAVAPRDRLAPVASEPGDPPGTTAAVGSIYVARGGPVVIGYQASGKARLALDGHELHECRGIAAGTVCRWVTSAGPHAIRFAASDTARLVWSPVGRRGDPEYVPASSLSPDPPERATFDAPGTARFDGAIALALVATLVGTLLALVRRRLRNVTRETWIAMTAVFAVAVIARWIDLGGFGQGWDEDVNWAAGRNYITNLLSFDAARESWMWNYEHPPVMKYLAGIGAQFADGFGPARALSAIWLAIGCALLVPIGARLYRFRVGVLAGVIAALLPPLVAHGQIVGHESPTVLWWALGILLSLTAFDEVPDGDRRTVAIRLAWIAVVIGVATASRFVNGLLGPLCVVILVVRAPRRWFTTSFIAGLTWMPVVALATIYLVWPRLWLHPVASLEESFAKLASVHSVEPFLGEVTNQPGPHYFVVYLFATLPLGVVWGVLAWIVAAIRRWSRDDLVVIAWFVVPLGVIVSPVRQDGVRYVMPSVVAFAMIAAAGFDACGTWIASRGSAAARSNAEHCGEAIERRLRHGFVAIAAAVVAYLVVVDIRIHPYYLDYFAEQVGGTETVQQHAWFETAWWGEGLDRAVAYVNEHAAPGAHVDRDCVLPSHLTWFREDLWTPMTHDPNLADWIVSYAPTSTTCAIPRGFHSVFEVTADGAVLARVWQR
jgi:4-amino-4-deoxy-L-arabinose transferase-like glycosyltransferase